MTPYVHLSGGTGSGTGTPLLVWSTSLKYSITNSRNKQLKRFIPHCILSSVAACVPWPWTTHSMTPAWEPLNSSVRVTAHRGSAVSSQQGLFSGVLAPATWACVTLPTPLPLPTSTPRALPISVMVEGKWAQHRNTPRHNTHVTAIFC